MTVSIRKTVLILSAVTSVLVIAGWSTQYYAWCYLPEEFLREDCQGLIRLFYLSRGGNLPAWFQSTSLLLCAVLFGLIGKTKKDSPYDTQSHNAHWKALAWVFLFLSLDEAAALHSGAGNRFSRMFNISGFFLSSYSWVLAAGIFFGGFLLWSRKFARQLPKKFRSNMFYAATTYLTGAVGWEMASLWYEQSFGRQNLMYMTFTVWEELFECIGIIMFVHALLTFLKYELEASRRNSNDPTRLHPLMLFIDD
jgi:hypothetical protein